MIREGQVWEYHLSGGKADVGNVEKTAALRFKGTVERNGTEYHRLIDLDTEETVALMREEYRQVYILLPEDKDLGKRSARRFSTISATECWPGWSLWPSGDMTGTTFSETLICMSSRPPPFVWDAF